jgi:glycosyltransferase involved in cell wall biosynthesis
MRMAPASQCSMTDARRTRVCVSLPFARQLLTGRAEYFGGAEVRGVTFARGLAANPAFDVHVVVLGDPAAPPLRVSGLTVHFRPDVPFDEGQQDDLGRSVWSVINAEVYVAFGANNASAELARFCLAHGSAFVLSIASDAAFDTLVHEGSTLRDAYGIAGHYHWFAIHHASAVVVQTERQQAAFRRVYQREALVIRNPAPAVAPMAPRARPMFGGRLLWIGRLDPNKRHEEALWLAAALPHRPMLMVCNGIAALGANHMQELERALPNLQLADQVALPDTNGLFRFSDVLVNTSVVEGFPNTFLQAGLHGIPVVTMAVDPDQMLSQHGCGAVADGTRAGLARTTEALLTNHAAYGGAAAACAQWVTQRHGAADRVAELADVVQRAAGQYRRAARRTGQAARAS